MKHNSSFNSSLSQTTSRSKNLYFTLAILFTLIAIGVHFYLSNSYFALKLGGAGGPSFCNINSTFNCDAVSASRYAAWFGISVALWGVVANLLNLVLLFTARFQLSTQPDRINRYAFYLSFMIAATSLVMGSISSFKIGSYCLFCIVTYALSFLTLACVYKTQISGAFSNFTSTFKDDVAALFIELRWVLVCALLVPAAAWLFNSMWMDSKGIRNLDQVVENSIQDWGVNSEQTFSAETGLHRGSDKPVMTIVEFADFLCPHCKYASMTLSAFQEGHPDVRLVFKSFPLDGTCNTSIEQSGDGVRCQLSYASLCAERSNKKGWEFAKKIFEHQEDFFNGVGATEKLQKIANELQVPWTELETCISSEEVRKNIESQAAEGHIAKIRGTPTVFVNGKLLPAGQLLPVLQRAYEKIKGH